MSATTPLPPKAHNTSYGQEFKEVLHLIKIMLEGKTLLTT